MVNFVSIGAIIADIILVATFVFSVFMAYRKGFTLLVFNSVCLIITLIAVIVLFKPVTNFVYDKTEIDEFFSKHIKNSIGEFLKEQLEENGKIDTEKTQIAKPIAEKINGYIDELEDKSAENVSKYVAEKLAYVVISAIIIILLCIVVRLATILLKFILYFLTELPFIHSIDKIGGIVYGVIRAYIIIYVILAVISLLSPLIANTGIVAMINNSRICEKFYNNNIFLKILLK